MKKKIVNVVLFLAVLAAAVAMTLYVGQGAVSVMVYNFIFLGVMVAIYVVGRMQPQSLEIFSANREGSEQIR